MVLVVGTGTRVRNMDRSDGPYGPYRFIRGNKPVGVILIGILYFH